MQSLRARLLLGIIAMVVLGLVVSDLATYVALESFLTQRVKDQLSAGVADAENYLERGAGFGGPGLGDGGRTPPQPPFPKGSYIELQTSGGTSVPWCVDYTSCAGAPKPVLPKPIPTAGGDEAIYTRVAGTGGVDSYMMLSERVDAPSISGDVLVLAIPLTDIESTLARLVFIEALISAVVLVGLAALAWWIIAIGLQPLARMQVAAAAIAAGDLSRRVEPATQHTEIGRLGLALNSMLAQIESAFAERMRSEQRLRRFIADASHELRTPLTSIRGYAELLRRRPAPSAEDAALARRRIEDEAVRMSGLVNDMLLLARLDQGRPLETEPVDLRAIASDACADARAVARERQIELSAPAPVVVVGDDARLRQVIANLLRNALVHTPAATPIEVSVSASGRDAVLTVADHGPGVDAGHLNRLFEPFFRADASRSRDSGGSGLGLSIVAAVIAAHHGRVAVDQTPGGGATFRVILPLAEREAPGGAISEAPEVARSRR